MELDFNNANKEIFGTRMMHNIWQHRLIPEEIFSDKGKTANDGTLAKTLFFGLVCQSRCPASEGSIDAANCFDSIAYATAVGVPEGDVESMLTAL